MGALTQDPDPGKSAVEGAVEAARLLLCTANSSGEARALAFERLRAKLVSLNEVSSEQPAARPESRFADAAIRISSGFVLIEAGKFIETADPEPLESALAELDEQVNPGTLTLQSYLFRPALLAPLANVPVDSEAAFDMLKARAKDTLDDMIGEAAEVIESSVTHLKDKVDKFISAFGDLAQSFTASGGVSWLRSGAEMVASGLRSLASFLHGDALRDAAAWVKDAAASSGDVKGLLAGALRRYGAQTDISKLQLQPAIDAPALAAAVNQLAELAVRFLRLMNKARWIVRGIAVTGGALVLSGAVAHAALAVPVAYAVVIAAVVFIFLDFADVGPTDFVPGIRTLLAKVSAP